MSTNDIELLPLKAGLCASYWGGRESGEVLYMHDYVLDYARAAIEADRQRRRGQRVWKPIGTAPEEGCWALVCGDGATDCMFIKKGQTPENWTKPANPNLWPDYVTHWMPIPAFHAEPCEPCSDNGAADQSDRKRRGEPVVLATYHAVVDENYKYIQRDIRTNQLEIYEEREDAVAAAPDHLGVTPVYVTSIEGPLFTTPQPAEPDVLPGEAIFGFAAWLTCRKTPVTFSECHDAAIGADLAAAYNDSQGFDQVREDYHKRLKPCPTDEPVQPGEPVKVRHETASEHIARDIREGRFPAKSDRKMVPVEQVKVPSDEDILQLFSELANNDEDGARFIYVEEGQAIDIARALLSRYGHAATPEGWQPVPKELTEEMHRAAVKAIQRCHGNDDFPPAVYAAMLKAAPKFGEEG